MEGGPISIEREPSRQVPVLKRGAKGQWEDGPQRRRRMSREPVQRLRTMEILSSVPRNNLYLSGPFQQLFKGWIVGSSGRW